jgi:hypothetical protein
MTIANQSPTGAATANPETGALDLAEVRSRLELAEFVAPADRRGAAYYLDDAIQALVDIRHSFAPGDRVRRYLPDLPPELVLMDNGQRWSQQEWRRSELDPDVYVDQDGVQCPPRCLPASLVVVPASAIRDH